MGHIVKLLPVQYVSPFVRGNKSDHNDTIAIAIAEAAHRPNITSVPIKSVHICRINSKEFNRIVSRTQLSCELVK